MYPGFYAASQPDKPAIVMAQSGERISYRELDDRSARLAQLLYGRGLRSGDKVALMAENHVRYLEVYWATLRSGLYLTAVNRYLAPEEAAYIVRDSEATALITTAALRATAEAMLDLIPGCPLRLMVDGAAPGFEAYEEAVAAYPAARLADQPRGEVMLYSSGTTGRPKGIFRPLSGSQIDDPEALGTGKLSKTFLGMDQSSIYLCPAPLYHSAPLAWSAGAQELGGTVVVMEKFDAEEFLRLIERQHVTHTQVVPTMFVRVMKLADEIRSKFDLSSLQGVIHAAAPCPVDVKRHVIEWLGPIVSEYYAATEGTGMTFITAPEWLAHPGSVGRPVVGVAHICDDEEKELPPGEPGLVYFEREEATFEYYRDPEKTRNTRHPDHPNWAALGDIGYLDDEGYLYLTDRRSFMIISGGVNIYPAEIESCLVMHPKVTDVAVFGLPDSEMGEYVHAVIQVAQGVVPSAELAEELRAYATSHLARYKVPRVVDFRDELPRLPTGKLYKQQLRNDYLVAARESATTT
jgi:acyl-CoA synthetase (AMP-forming)/AMP-acid ligase II